jgi:hypothetical protein
VRRERPPWVTLNNADSIAKRAVCLWPDELWIYVDSSARFANARDLIGGLRKFSKLCRKHDICSQRRKRWDAAVRAQEEEHRMAGNDALREGLLIDAVHHYTEALRHVSGSHLALSNRAYVRCLLGRRVIIGWG